MPSGARKRKASKKKGKNGEAHNNNSISKSSSSNSSSTHSQGSEDPRSLDDRESDSGEVEREEEEKEEAIGEVKVVDFGKGLSDEIAEITQEEAKNEKIETLGVQFGGVDVAKETPISVPSNGGLQDKEVVVEEVKSMVAVSESKALDVSSVLETKPKEEIPNQDPIAVELVKDVDVGLGGSVASDLVESKLIKNADLALQNSDVKEDFPSTSKDLQLEKTESKIVSKDEDKSVVTPPIDFKALDAGKQLEEQLVAPAVTVTTQVAESVKNKETLELSDNQAGLTVVVSTTSEVETQTRSIDQNLIGSNPLPVRRTSWMGCCGLFELFSGANR